MWFVGLGVLLGALKLLDIGPPSVWSWWLVLTPFGLAVLWWSWADWSGHTKRKEMEKMDARKIERRQKNLVSLGIDPRAHDKKMRRVAAGQPASLKEASKVDKKREAQRRKNQDSILNSRIDPHASSRFGGGGPDTKR